jgi:hypothetical protein
MHLREPTGAELAFRPDVMLSPDEQLEPSLPLGSDGVRRWVWRNRFGEVLIEVVDEQVYVNGRPVAPYVA